MRQKMFLKQQVKYASMIDRALSLCEIMLNQSQTLYPFAALSIDNHVHCIFLEDTLTDKQQPNGAQFEMIEQLERQISISKTQAKSAIGMLVYAATISSPQQEDKDGLMLSICDADGENTLTLYPYEFDGKSISIGKPFTCDFSD